MEGIISEIQQVAEGYDPISLADMDAVQLLNRMDTKFLMPATQLPQLLQDVSGSYRSMFVNDVCGTSYQTLYFDTADLLCYMDHHNGRSLRNKIRMREYVGSDLCFLEVKRKTGSGRTDKVRRRIKGITETMDSDQTAFVRESVIRGSQFKPVLWNSFKRYTLVHKELAERLTIDVNLRFERHGNELKMQNIVICELKQGRFNMGSDFYKAMRHRGIRPAGMSKYCMGMLLTDETLKRNSFKPTILKIERIQKAA